ncbi:NB-ARC domain-containing protein [Kribbella sp. CA-294648]|uniref:NB-ARC domain-containing protein n=1 Tax=Kribbella sp. CA-294648 TaxID=3239948 RepID=UPI003D8A9562
MEERSSLLRSTLAGRAVLLVFDDVLDAGQLRPLMPAGGRCAVIATSRQPLLGLEDAVHREVQPLGEEPSAQLLGSLTGIQPTDLTQIIQYCAGLPLALRIVGARLGIAREDVAEVLRSLADDTRRLDYLVAGDRAVRASLELTLRSADPVAQRLFALLYLVGADEFSSWVAAPLLGLGEAQADAVFDGLVALGLLQQRRTEPATYGMHGLVRSYSGELLAQISPEVLAGIEERYLSTVLRLLTIADEQIEHGVMLLIPIDSGSSRTLPAADVAAAKGADWLDGELPVIQAAIALAAERQVRLAAMLTLRLQGYLTVRDHREIAEAILRRVRDAVAVSGSPELESELDRALFGVRARFTAPLAELSELAQRSLASAVRTGTAEARILALGQVGWAAEAAADGKRQLEAAQRMLALLDEDPSAAASRARAFDHQGGAMMLLGRIAEAQQAFREGIRATPAGSRVQAIRQVNLADALLAGPDRGSAHVDELSAVLTQARETVERLGDTLGLAYVCTAQGRLMVALGELDSAGELLEQAAAIFRDRPARAGEVANAMGIAALQFTAGQIEPARNTLRTELKESGTGHFPFNRHAILHQWALFDPEGCPAELAEHDE